MEKILKGTDQGSRPKFFQGLLESHTLRASRNSSIGQESGRDKKSRPNKTLKNERSTIVMMEVFEIVT